MSNDIVWIFTHVDNPKWFAWDCVANTKEELYKKFEAYGRTKAQAKAMGLVAVMISPQIVGVENDANNDR
jgi:hypothetical protein